MNRKFIEHATQLGVDTTHLIMQFIYMPEDEKNQILKNYHQSLANSLGVDWQDYIEINPYLSHL